MLPRDSRVKPTREHVDAVMKRIGNGIRALGLPAIEKISEEQSGTAFHVLIATMLSAQTRDPVTLEASTRLFAKAPTPEAMAKLSEAQIEKLIYPVSFYRNKAAHVKATCRKLLAEFGGVAPSTMDELLTLPGVGRKTANLVRIVAHRRPDSICVDTHVHRIANRFGWVRTRTPEQTERALYEVTAKKWWSRLNLYLVTWASTSASPSIRCVRAARSSACARASASRGWGKRRIAPCARRSLSLPRSR